MAGKNKIKVFVETLIDNSSLSDIQKELIKKRFKINGDISFEDSINSKKEYKKQISRLAGEIKQIFKKEISEALQWAKQYYDSMISEAKQLGKKQLNSYGALNSKVLDDAKASADSLFTASNKPTDPMSTDSERISAEEEYQRALAKTQNPLAQVSSVSDNELVNIGDERRVYMIDTLNDYLARNTAMGKENKQVIQEWVSVLSSSDDMTVGAIKNINTQFQALDARLKTTGKLGLSWTDKLKQAWEKLGSWGLLPDLLNTVVSNFSAAVSRLKDLDTILTEINQSSGLTKQQLEDLGSSAFETAGKYGKSASDYLAVVKEMYDAGFDNAQQMSQLSMLAQAAGGLDPSTANAYLIASNAAYDLKGNAEALNNILDGQSYIAKNATVSMENMALATSEAASTASRYGVQVDELSALIATAISNTHESGSETGNALNAIFANLQDASSTSVTEALDSVNISITETVNGSKSLKTPIQLLQELSDALADLDAGDSRREAILNNIGGDAYADTLSALLSDWSSYEQLLSLYSQGMGNAAKEAEKTAGSWEGSLNRLSNTWTDTVENVVNSDAIVTGINTLNGLLGGINSVTDALGSLGTIGLGAGLFAGIKNVGRAKMSALI